MEDITITLNVSKELNEDIDTYRQVDGLSKTAFIKVGIRYYIQSLVEQLAKRKKEEKEIKYNS